MMVLLAASINLNAAEHQSLPYSVESDFQLELDISLLPNAVESLADVTDPFNCSIQTITCPCGTQVTLQWCNSPWHTGEWLMMVCAAACDHHQTRLKTNSYSLPFR